MEYDGYETLQFERLDHVLRVTLDRPGSELNAVDAALHDELTRLVRELQEEDEARVVLLTGRGRAFSAGGDFAWFPELREPGRMDRLRRDAKNLIWDLLDVQLPIVCALNGHAMGLGASIALLCDVIFAARSARIGDPHVKVGIVAGDGGTAIWPLAIGPARAKHHLMTGEPLTAEEAERIGLVNFCVDDDELEQKALDYARRLAAGAPLAVQYTKQAINQQLKQSLALSFDLASALEVVTFHSEDHREALEALREKREPRFEGR